jgi:multicomponent Na+:H+ antiporter subunit B
VSSSILRTAARVLMPLLIILAVFLLLRGHDEPGGGFVAGLVIAIAFVLLLLADGVAAARSALLISPPRRLLGIGLLVALASALIPVLLGRPFLTACWMAIGPPEWELKVGTPLLFDIGVCLVVIGVVLTMIFNLAED